MDYGEILQRAWKIIWKHKVLWIFGILASCSRSSGGGSGGGGGNAQYRFDQGDFPSPNGVPPALQGIANWFERMVSDGTIWIVITAVVLVVLLLILLAIVLGTLGRAGLVRGAWLGDEGQEKITFSELWRFALRYFWRVLLVSILFFVLSIVGFALLILPALLFSVATLFIGCCFVVLFFIAFFWLLNTLLDLSVVSIVAENRDIFESIRLSWEMIKKNLVPVIVISLILNIALLIFRLLIALPALLVIIPIVIGVMAGSQTALTTGLITAGIIFLLYLPVAIFLGGMAEAYYGTVWTVVYRRLTGRAAGDLAPSAITPLEPAPITPWQEPASGPEAVVEEPGLHDDLDIGENPTGLDEEPGQPPVI